MADFESALADRDIDRVVGKFATDSFWRDLVAFTWNLKTVEGREGIADMLTARLHDTDPTGFRTSETPTEDFDGEHVITSAFIEFETATGRGPCSPRCRNSRATRNERAPPGRWARSTAPIPTPGRGPRSGSTRS